MKELISDLRLGPVKAIDAWEGPFNALATKMLMNDAADALESYQWNTDMEAGKKQDGDVLLYLDGRTYVGQWTLGIMGNPHCCDENLYWRCSLSGDWIKPTAWMPLPPAPEGV